MGRITGYSGTLLSILALIVFIVVATALDTTKRRVGGLIDRIREEVDKVDVPNVNTPDVNGPTPPDSGGGSSGGESGGTAAPGQ
jgi:MFS superfamily sulfate permease-like transporter